MAQHEGCEIGTIKLHIETIKEDLSELKQTHKTLVELVGKMIYFENKFSSIDDNINKIWIRLDKNKEKFKNYTIIENAVLGWKKGITKVWIGLFTLALLDFIKTYLMLKGIH